MRRAQSRPIARSILTVGPLSAQDDAGLELVRAFRSGSFGRSLSCMLPELAMMMLFRVLVRFFLILNPCDSMLVTVLPAAPI